MDDLTYTECPKCHYKRAMLESNDTVYCKSCGYYGPAALPDGKQ